MVRALVGQRLRGFSDAGLGSGTSSGIRSQEISTHLQYIAGSHGPCRLSISRRLPSTPFVTKIGEGADHGGEEVPCWGAQLPPHLSLRGSDARRRQLFSWVKFATQEGWRKRNTFEKPRPALLPSLPGSAPRRLGGNSSWRPTSAGVLIDGKTLGCPFHRREVGVVVKRMKGAAAVEQ